MRNYQISKTATAGPGADSVLRQSSRAQGAEPDLSGERCCKLRLNLLAKKT